MKSPELAVFVFFVLIIQTPLFYYHISLLTHVAHFYLVVAVKFLGVTFPKIKNLRHAY